MSVTLKEVEHIAKLAKLQFNNEEIESFTSQLNQILTYVEKLNELDTSQIEPLSHPVEGYNIFREDIPIKKISTEEALKNSPQHDEDFFKVPKVIGNSK